MRILADHQRTAALLGALLPVAPTPAAPGPAERALWSALAPETEALAGLEAPGFWSVGCAVAHAAASQYDVLRRLAATGALPPGHLACAAASGAGFHGQHGRPWRALDGNVHLSIALEADLPAAAWGPVLPALPALAALDAVAELGGGRPAGLKWVNDVLVDGAKVAGVLASVRVRDGRIERVFLGIGVNVAAAPVVEDGLPATCLAAGRDAPAAAAVAAAVLAALERRWRSLTDNGPAALAAAYRAASLAVGRRVFIRPDADAPGRPSPPRRGTVTAIGDDLSLHLDDGGPPVTCGRLAWDDA